LLIFSPFFLVALGLGRGLPETMQLLTPVMSMTGLAIGVLLPFLILSFANPFYRERLRNLLRLAPPAYSNELSR
jgi:hypothetical protein